MNRTTHRRITPLWLTCGAGALAGLAVLTEISSTSAQSPTASRWSSAPVEQPVNPATAPARTYRVGDQAPGPTRLSSNPARPSLSDAQRISEPPEESHLVRLPPIDDEPSSPGASRSVSDEPVASVTSPSPKPNTEATPAADPASLVEIVPGRSRDEALQEVAQKPQTESFISRFSKQSKSEPIASSAFANSARATVTDEPKPAQPEVPANPTSENLAEQSAPTTPPSKPEPRRPANRIDWNHPQVVIGPAQPTGTPIQNQHVVQASGEAEDFFSFDPTRGEPSADKAENQTATPATEAPNQFAQGFEKGAVKTPELKTPPQQELSPITACRILGLKPATERR